MTYASVIAADAPVAWWKLNETSGTSAADAGSGTANNGTITGDPTLGIPGIDGLDSGGGTCYLLDGNGDYITCGTLAAKLQFAVGASFSIEAWVQIPQSVLDAGATYAGASLVTEAYAGDGNVRYMLGFYDGSAPTLTPSFGWYNGAWRLKQASAAVSTEVWHHLVGTFNGTVLELFVDGTSQGTTTPGGTQPGGTETLYLGKRWDTGSGQYLHAYLDMVAIYSVALTGTQVSAHYAAFNPSKAPARATAAIAEFPVKDTTPQLRATTAILEYPVKDTTAQLRATLAYVEIVVERDYAFWGMGSVEGDTGFSEP